MNQPAELRRITCEVFKEISPSVEAALAELGAGEYFLQTARLVMLKENKRIFFGETLSPVGEMADVFQLCVPADDEARAMDAIIEAGQLYHEGRGSVYSEHVEVLLPTGAAPRPERINKAGAPGYSTASGMVMIVCVVNRGRGDVMARHALELGLCVPRVAFGTGAGLRDKLGLIRITIPPEKEIVHIVAPHHDERAALASLIDAGRLDRPGQGFIFSCPLSRALLNTRLYVTRHADMASIGRIVAALDELKGGTEWRSRAVSIAENKKIKKNRYQEDMAILNIFCAEGHALRLAQAAIDAGAGGATMSRVRKCGGCRRRQDIESPAGEQCIIAVESGTVERALKALEAAEVFSEEADGEIHINRCRQAYTYAGAHFSAPCAAPAR